MSLHSVFQDEYELFMAETKAVQPVSALQCYARQAYAHHKAEHLPDALIRHLLNHEDLLVNQDDLSGPSSEILNPEILDVLSEEVTCSLADKSQSASTLSPEMVLRTVSNIVYGKQPYQSLTTMKHRWLVQELLPAALERMPSNPGNNHQAQQVIEDAQCYQRYVLAIDWMYEQLSSGMPAAGDSDIHSQAFQTQQELQKIAKNADFFKANPVLVKTIERFLGLIQFATPLENAHNASGYTPMGETFTVSGELEKQALKTLALYDKRLQLLLNSRFTVTKIHIKAAYRRIMKRYHPDQTQQSQANEIIVVVNSAYASLKPLLAA